MARVLDWPIGLGRLAYQRLSGPRTVGAASTESVQGWLQTVSSAFGLWRYQISLQTINKAKYRRYRGMVTALHGGANAVRVPFTDPDVMSFAEAGVVGIPDHITHASVNWSNGLPWSNGQGWQMSRPIVGVAQAAALGGTNICLNDEFWGHALAGGEWIGFLPLHFGKYEVTEVKGDGLYRIWPPLRKALTTDDFATLNPVMAMRLESESGGTVQRGKVASEGNTLTLVEVEDADVRDYFAD